MGTAIWWVRRDLRLADNQALTAALAEAGRVIPTVILDPVQLESPYAGPKPRAFFLAALRALDADLRARGSRLVVRQGDPPEALARLVHETAAQAVFAEASVSPYAQDRDARAAEVVPVRWFGGLTVHPPDAVRKADGKPYVVYTPFSRVWKALPPVSPDVLLPAPAQFPPPPDVPSLDLPTEPALPAGLPFSPGEEIAQQRLAAFLDGDDAPIYRYAAERDRMDLDTTSHLSPYLRLGMLSVQQAVAGALEAAARAPNDDALQGAETWLKELIWREFYMAILYNFPHVLEESFRPQYRAIPWVNDEGDFAAWCAGKTGYPVVDAAMRQLAQIGWMHNRARMVVASFLVKDLLVDWRRGERFFMQHLVDGDPPANNGGWQWTAGTGTDAAPYFRILNPVLQGRKHDPQGAYIRRWVPELAAVPDPFIHTPWEMPADVQRAADCLVGRHYPAPRVDHAEARSRALAAFAQSREAAKEKRSEG